MHPAIKNISFEPTEKVPPRPVVHDWDVKRSGAGQTVIGKDPEGRNARIANVVRVKRATGRTYALDARGAVLAYLADGPGDKTIPLTEKQAAGLPVKAERVADLSLEDCRMLSRWADYQSAALWDDMTLQEILNVYRVSWEWDCWEGWASEDRYSAHKAWNSAVIDPGNQMDTAD